MLLVLSICPLLRLSLFSFNYFCFSSLVSTSLSLSFLHLFIIPFKFHLSLLVLFLISLSLSVLASFSLSLFLSFSSEALFEARGADAVAMATGGGETALLQEEKKIQQKSAAPEGLIDSLISWLHDSQSSSFISSCSNSRLRNNLIYLNLS